MKQWLVLIVTGGLGGMLAVRATEPAKLPDEGLLEYLGSVGGEPGLAEYLEHDAVVAKARVPAAGAPKTPAPAGGGGQGGNPGGGGQSSRSGAEKNS